MLLCRCQDCGTVQPIEELEVPLWEVPDLCERIEVGEVVPAGECNECGALASPLVSEYAVHMYYMTTGRQFSDLSMPEQLRYGDLLRFDPTDDEMRAAVADVESVP